MGGWKCKHLSCICSIMSIKTCIEKTGRKYQQLIRVALLTCRGMVLLCFALRSVSHLIKQKLQVNRNSEKGDVIMNLCSRPASPASRSGAEVWYHLWPSSSCVQEAAGNGLLAWDLATYVGNQDCLIPGSFAE